MSDPANSERPADTVPAQPEAGQKPIEPTKPPAARRGFLDRIDQSWTWQLLRVVEPLSILLAVIGLFVELASHQDSRIVSAWQLLTTQASGNSGKIEALEYLNAPRWWGLFGAPRASLQGIDLSASGAGTYLAGVDLRSAELSRASFNGADLDDADLSDADLQRSILTHVQATDTVFTDAEIDFADLGGAVLKSAQIDRTSFCCLEHVPMADAALRDGTMARRNVQIAGGGIVLMNVEVSGAWIDWKSGPDSQGRPPLGYVWAKKDAPASTVPPSLKYFECDKPSDVAPLFDPFPNLTGTGTGTEIYKRWEQKKVRPIGGSLAGCIEKPPPVTQFSG